VNILLDLELDLSVIHDDDPRMRFLDLRQYLWVIGNMVQHSPHSVDLFDHEMCMMDPDFSADSMDCMNLGLGVVTLKHSNLVFDYEVLISDRSSPCLRYTHKVPATPIAILRLDECGTLRRVPYASLSSNSVNMRQVLV
jgi:hypothetical protein